MSLNYYVEDVSAGTSPEDSQAECNHNYLEGLCLLNGLPLFSDRGQQWIEERAGSKMSSAILDKLHRPWQSQHPSSSNSPSIHHQESPKLPSFESVERIAMAFCSSMQFLVFPVLSLDRFVKQTLPLAYAEGNGNQHGVRSAKACVYGLIFTSDIFGHNNDRDMSEAVSACESYALELEDSIPMILREMTADGLEALSMLVSTTISFLRPALTKCENADHIQIFHGRSAVCGLPRTNDNAPDIQTWSPCTSSNNRTIQQKQPRPPPARSLLGLLLHRQRPHAQNKPAPCH